MDRIRRWINDISAHITIWQVVVGSGVVSFGAVTAWLASISAWLDSYGPIGWWGAGVLGALAAVAIVLGIGKARLLWQLARFRSRVVRHSNINPLETVFRNQRIRIGDLSPPIGGVVRNKTFIDCELIGPANLFFFSCQMAGNGGEGVDGLMVAKGLRPTNGLAFEQCSFQRCRFYLVTFMVHEDALGDFRNYAWNGVNWITNIPGSPTRSASPAPQLPLSTEPEKQP